MPRHRIEKKRQSYQQRLLQELRADYERHFSKEQDKEASLTLYFKVPQIF